MNTDYRRFWEEENRVKKGWIRPGVLLASAIITGLIMAFNEEKTSLIQVLLWALVPALLVPYEYMTKHLTFAGKTEGGIGLQSLALKQSVADVARFYSFDTKGYFGLLYRRYLPFYLLGAGIWVFDLIYKKDTLYLVPLGLALVGPLLVFGIEWAVFLYDICHEKKNLAMLLRGLWQGLAGMADGIAVSVSLITGGLLAYAVLTACLYGIEENEIELVTDQGLFLFFALAGLVLVFVALFLNLSVKWKRVSVRLLVLDAGILLFGLGVAGAKNRLVVREDEFIVEGYQKSRVYTLDMVEDFTLFDDNNLVNMEVKLSDGTGFNLIGQNVMKSDAWNKRYYGREEYFLNLVKKLRAKGIEGRFSLEDQKSLTGAYKTLDRRLNESLAELCSLYESP